MRGPWAAQRGASLKNGGRGTTGHRGVPWVARGGTCERPCERGPQGMGGPWAAEVGCHEGTGEKGATGSMRGPWAARGGRHEGPGRGGATGHAGPLGCEDTASPGTTTGDTSPNSVPASSIA